MKTTGSVQEKNGRFYFVVNLYDANGKRKIKWISTGLTVRGNKRKAESMLREVLLHYDETGELPTGRGGTYEKVDAKTAKPLPLPLQPVNKSEMLFLDYLNEWVQVHKASIQPATFISYNRMITGRITQYFEPLGLKLCEVTPQVLDEFQEKILLEGYTTNTVIHYHAIFGKAFKDAVRKDYLETNPMLKVDRPKKNSFRPNFYSKDEVQQLLEVSQDDPLHLCILITAYYGLRRSEVLGLKWSSIDFVPEKIMEAAERLRGVQIENRPAVEVIRKFNFENVLIYCDPPYVLSTRCRKQYRHEMTDEDHEVLLEALLQHKGPAIISGYSSPLYEERLKDWYREERINYVQYGRPGCGRPSNGWNR